MVNYFRLSGRGRALEVCPLRGTENHWRNQLWKEPGVENSSYANSKCTLKRVKVRADGGTKKISSEKQAVATSHEGTESQNNGFGLLNLKVKCKEKKYYFVR